MLRLKILSIIFVLLFISNASSDIFPPTYSTTANFLKNVNSAQSVGMGGVTVNLVNNQSAFYNPGAHGLYYLDKVVSVSMPRSTEYLKAIADDIKLKTKGGGVGFSRNLLLKNESDLNISFGFSYSTLKFEYSDIQRLDPLGNPLETIHSFEEAKFYTFGIGIDYKFRLGIGYTHKKIKSHLIGYGSFGNEIGSGTRVGSAYDFGILLELPYNSLVKSNRPADVSPDFNITPSIAYVKSNVGDDVYYIDAAFAEKLPEISRTGVGLKIDRIIDWEITYYFLFAFEKEKDAVNDINIYNRYGGELGLAEVIKIRAGKTTHRFDADNFSTFGLGVSARGIMKMFELFKTDKHTDSYMGYLLKNLDIKFDWARINQKGGPKNETVYWNLDLSF